MIGGEFYTHAQNSQVLQKARDASMLDRRDFMRAKCVGFLALEFVITSLAFLVAI